MTPIQEALSKLGMMRQAENENVRMTLNANEVAMMLNSLLPKEKALISQAWDAGIEAFCFENGSEFVEGKPPNKTDFINQLYTEK